ncbi:MAG: hypothetical protein R8G66_04480 [Cytophagales bacterium]|nr:hypothetical protein [Cytophagales bacterium]
MKKILALLIISLLHVPTSCLVECGPFPQRLGRPSLLLSEIGTFFNEQFNQWRLLRPIPWQESAIRVYIDEVTFATHEPERNLSLSSFAMACDPPFPEYPLVTRVDMIVSSAFVFAGDVYAVGDTVSHLFNIASEEGSPVLNFSEPETARYLPIADFGEMVFQWNEAPGETLETNFRVVVTFEDEVTLVTQTPDISIF